MEVVVNEKKILRNSFVEHFKLCCPWGAAPRIEDANKLHLSGSVPAFHQP